MNDDTLAPPPAHPDPVPARPPQSPAAVQHPSPPAPAAAHDDDRLELGHYAQRAYLEYALSVVKGRALPDVSDGMKPVQRRILYAMQRMGLGWGNGANAAARPVKSARVVGDVLGRFHPHGDQSAYDALVRMAQDFSQRYPLVDGQGNFGSRDGDAAAAMRYTEARLSRITALLLDEIDEGTVEFQPNYDGSTQEPAHLPARLPFALLNGASGIAVGLATEIPSHNLREVADACIALLHNPGLDDDALATLIPGPDYPGGGQIISNTQDIANAYRTGRGSLKVRARWSMEELARSQWQMVVHELPPGVSAQKILQEIEELTNPKVKPGKKTLTQEQQQLKAAVLAVLDSVRDESGKDAPVRLVFEPRTGKIPQSDLVHTLLAHTSLQTSTSINLTMIGLDGRPVQKSLRQMLLEWITFRQHTITRRCTHRLQRVQQRIHILQGRQTALLHLDAVIALIRDSDAPKPELMHRFGLSEQQAEDILELRLRQLARLEAIKIDKELGELAQEAGDLRDVLDHPASLQRLMAREITADAKAFADPRRTLIQPDKAVTAAAVTVPDEAITVILSTKGWVRAHKGHGHEAGHFTFKAGDQLRQLLECRSVEHLLVFGSNGRTYSVPVASLPGGRGDGQPIGTLIDLEAGTHIVGYYAGPASSRLIISNSGGYGFIAQVEHMLARNRSGKAFATVQESEVLCPPAPIPPTSSGPSASTPTPDTPLQVACLSAGGQLLTFALDELKPMTGGRGLQLMKLEPGDQLLGAVAYHHSVRITGRGRGDKPREETLEPRSLRQAAGRRGGKGRLGGWTFKLTSLTAVA